MPAVWWVNQKNPQYAIDLARGYRWSPDRTRKGGLREAWRCLQDMQPGDIWLNWHEQAIVSIGVVTQLPEPMEWPEDQGDQERWPGAGGHRVWFENTDMLEPIRADEIPDAWKRKAGPFRENLWVKLSSVESVDPAASEELRQMFADRWPEGSPWFGTATHATLSRRTRYWLNIHTPDSWDRFLGGEIDVITSKHESSRIQCGDIFINFVSGDGGRWVSAEEVVSESSPVATTPYPGYESRWEWRIRPLTKRLSRDEGVVVRDKTRRLDLFRGHEDNWGVRVRQSGAEITEHDAELVIGWIESASEETD